jgi:propionyl-CoA carboxylase alpha chain
LTIGQDDVVLEGHAVEARVYAEDPGREFLPTGGRVHALREPAGPGVRVDSGLATGSVIGSHYDPMLAKVIAWAPTRVAAARTLAAALRGARIHGLVTNRDLLVNVLEHPEFLAGATDTAFFDRHGLDTLSVPIADEPARAVSALAAALADAAANRRSASVLGALPSGWRNVPSQEQLKNYAIGDVEYPVRYRMDRGRLSAPDHPGIEVLGTEFFGTDAGTDGPPRVCRVRLCVDGIERMLTVSRYGDLVCVDSALGPVTFVARPRFTDPERAVAPGSLLAPMPGSVLRIDVAAGDRVGSGQPLLWLEAMKMEHTISAPVDGVVVELNVRQGQQVDVGAVLAVVRSGEEEES